MAIAFIRVDEHPAAYSYYKLFSPHEPIAGASPIQLSEFVKTTAKTALALLTQIAGKAKPKAEVVIVTHGTELGLAMPLAPGSNTFLERDAIAIYLDGSLSPTEKQQRLQLSAKQLAAFTRAVDRVQRLALARVEFRACNVGKEAATLAALRDLFGAKLAGGPELADAYAPLPRPFFGPKHRWWTDNPTAEIETMSGGDRVGYRLLNVTATSFGFQWAVDSRRAQREWLRLHFPLAKSHAKKPPAIHGMLDPSGSKLWFPGDPQYRQHLNVS